MAADPRLHRLQLAAAARASSLSSSTLRSITSEPSKMSPYSEGGSLVKRRSLSPERPLLVARVAAGRRLVPRGSWTARARAFFDERPRHRQQDAVDVVLGLLLGHAASSPARRRAISALRIGDAVAPLGDLVHRSTKARIFDISVMKRTPALTNGARRLAETRAARRRRPHLSVARPRRRQGEGKLLIRRGSRLLQVIGQQWSWFRFGVSRWV